MNPPEPSPQSSSRALFRTALVLVIVLAVVFGLLRSKRSSAPKDSPDTAPSGQTQRRSDGTIETAAERNRINELALSRATDAPPPVKRERSQPAPDGTLTTTGTVVAPDGTGVGGVRLIIFAVQPGMGQNVSTAPPYEIASGPNGEFEVAGIPPSPERTLKITSEIDGEWVVESPVTARPGDIDVIVPVKPIFSKGKVHGRALEGTNRSPVQQMTVRLTRLRSGRKEASVVEAVTDSTGKFSFENLKAGPYRILSPEPPSGKSLRGIIDPNATDQSAAAFGVISISAQFPDAERNLILGGPFRLSGRVLDINTQQGVAVSLAPVEGTGDKRTQPMAARAIVTEADGTFLFEDCGAALRPGLQDGARLGLALLPPKSGPGYTLVGVAGGTDQSYCDADMGIAWIVAEDADATGLDGVVLKVTQGGGLRGIVVNANEQPQQGAKIFLTETPDQVRESPGSVSPLAITAADGLFHVRTPLLKTVYAGAQTAEGGVFFSPPITLATGEAQTKIVVENGSFIEGIVVDPQGSPVEAAEVTLDVRGPAQDVSAQSGKDGEFVLKTPGGVRSQVRAAKDGFFPSEPVDANRSNLGIPLKLILGESAGARGLVVDPQGQPVGGVDITLFGDGSRDFSQAIEPTTADGKFEIAPLRKGKAYSVTLTRGNIDKTAFGLVAGGAEQRIVLELDLAMRCRIILTNAQGEAVTPYVVTLHADRRFPIDRNPSGSGPWTCSNPDGKIELTLSPGADFFFEVSTQDFGSTTSGKVRWEEVSNRADLREQVFEFPLTLGGVFNVTGRFVSAAQPTQGLPGLPLSLRILSPRQDFASPAATTGLDGAFAFNAVPSGGYELSVDAPPRPPLRIPVSATSPEGGALGDIPWLGLGNLDVTVLGASNEPRAGAILELLSSQAGGIQPAMQQTDGAGKASWKDLPEGTYSVRLAAENRGQEATILPGQDTSIEFQLGVYQALARVLYRGSPVANAPVTLRARDSGTVLTMRTNGSGEAQFSSLAAGAYLISAAWPQGFFGEFSAGISPLNVPAREFTLEGDPQQSFPPAILEMPSGVLAGMVTDQNISTPDSPGVSLRLYADSNPSESLWSGPDAQGFFSFPGLPPGNYHIHMTSATRNEEYSFSLADGEAKTNLLLPQL